LRLAADGWKFDEQEEDYMRYIKPMIAIQGDKNGLPNDSNGIEPQTVGAAYPVDE
jgi:hypothetical protein